MANRPLGVTILAILQLLGALSWLFLGFLVLAVALLLPPLAMLIALIPLFIGIIGFILFLGLWGLKSWAWIWTIVANILSIIVIVAQNTVMVNIIQLAISLIIVIYLFSPGIKSHFR
jgi:hypothetical protein